MREFQEIIKSIMPSDSEIKTDSNSGDYISTISWLLKNDPQRDNKRSKIIKLVISKEVVDDFNSLSETEKEGILPRFRESLTTRLKSFNPDHSNPSNVAQPVEEWCITTAELFR